MSTKVLVFESDPAFAGELRTELGKLGCSTTVVEDGNVGLQQAGTDKPDLILLSIELPRMNGFSVCNKLKKDAALKDVPLIIMSSESSDETFEQHKKLRTRAEDYVHKPIAFGELLQHIQGFVPIGSDASSEGEAAIVIEEDIDSTDYLVEDDAASIDDSATEPAKDKVDADVEAFAESAFGRLTETEPVAAPAPAHPAANGASRKSVVPATAPRASVRPAPAPVAAGVDPAEHERVVADLGRARERVAAAESELAAAKREIDKLRMDAGDVEHLTREVEELKTKLASGAKGGAVSSREFLDLREGLNKKDKEILSLKEQISKKDKEIVETQEKMLGLERSKADLDDKLLLLERELGDARDKSEALSGEFDRARKSAEDLRGRLDRALAEADAKDKALAELKSKSASDVASLESKVAAIRAEVDQTLANERAEHGRVVDEAEARRKAELEQARHDHEAALAEASEKATRERNAAVEARASQLAREHADKLEASKAAHDRELSAAKAAHEQDLAAAKDAHRAELERAKAEAGDALRAAEQRREDEVAAARKEAQDRLAQAAAEAERHEQSALDALRAEHAEKVATVENDRDARIATLESKATREIGEAHDRLAKLEVELSVVRGELESLRETKRADDVQYASKVADLDRQVAEGAAARVELEKTLAERSAKAESEGARADRAHAKWEADRQSLERAKDALAVALAQIEEAEGRGL